MQGKRIRRTLLALVITAVAGAASAGPAQAATCTVPGTEATIQDAIDNVACDPINVAAGTYVDQLTITRNLTLQGAGPGATIVGAGSNTSLTVFHPMNAITVTVSGFSFLGTGQGVNVAGNTTLNLSDAVISGHSAGFGGGILVTGGSGATLNGSRLTITGNTATTAGNGGGGIATTGDVVLSDSTISGNTATGAGGGIRNGANGSSVALTNVTLFGNKANGDGNGGGLALGSTDTATIRNSIVADNTDKTPMAPSGLAHDCTVGGAATLTRAGYVLVERVASTAPADPCTFGGADTAVGFQTGFDPLLSSALASNGGPTQTLALLTGSPAINTGNPLAPGSGGNACPATDQRGLPRGGGAGVCDLGAFEVQPPAPVTLTPSTPAPFDLAGAIKKCKKKFPKGPKRKKCIRKAKAQAR